MNQLDMLLHQAEKRRDDLIHIAERLIAFPTPAPPARNTAEAQKWVAGFLKETGCSVDMWDVYPEDPNVVGVLKGTDSNRHQSLILNGHIDVAEVQGEDWDTDPFQPLVKDGMLIGRGAADMKGGLACVLFALQLIHDAGIKLAGDLIVQSVIGEEVGEAGTLECCKRGYYADFAVVADTSSLHIQGQGGVITGWIELKSKKTFHDGMRRNLIHAGGGAFGASAIEKMAKIITALGELERHWAVTKSYPALRPAPIQSTPPSLKGEGTQRLSPMNADYGLPSTFIRTKHTNKQPLKSKTI